MIIKLVESNCISTAPTLSVKKPAGTRRWRHAFLFIIAVDYRHFFPRNCGFFFQNQSGKQFTADNSRPTSNCLQLPAISSDWYEMEKLLRLLKAHLQILLTLTQIIKFRLLNEDGDWNR